MNREQMIAWLALEGVELFTVPIFGDEQGRVVWAARDGNAQLQRYTDKPDTWDRYTEHPLADERVWASLEDLNSDELRELYEHIMRHRV